MWGLEGEGEGEDMGWGDKMGLGKRMGRGECDMIPQARWTTNLLFHYSTAQQLCACTFYMKRVSDRALSWSSIIQINAYNAPPVSIHPLPV